MTLLNIQPKRTIRFALWNGEEQGLYGSWAYTQTHLNEMDNHKMALSVDIGTGKIIGFYTGGRQDCTDATTDALRTIEKILNLKLEQINAALVGTDNFDFMIQGVANLVANHEEANYAHNYHAESDTYDKVDMPALKQNAAVVAALTLAYTNQDYVLPRHTRAQVQNLINTTDLEAQMKSFGVWNEWLEGRRGIK
jgi:Zn-dependent M28 family amino/carboxypeptidase